MYGILVSALYTALGWIFRVVVFKAMVFGVLFYITTEFTQAVLTHLTGNSVDALGSAIGSLPSGALYFIGLLKLNVGLPLIFSAYATAFAIRRLPVIG
jgi:hypothetical protein